MNLKNTVAAVACAASLMVSAQTARALDEITVAYFLEWPMPFQFAKVNGTYEEALGVKINWVSFDTGTAMSAAMASGDVQIAVSQGVPPFVVATSAGQDLQVVDVAVSYADNDNCVVAEALEIDGSNAAELAGKKVGVPIGTAAHYGFLKQMEHFSVDVSSMEIVDMAPQDGQVAFAQGNLDMVCGWGGALRRMLEDGNVLLSGDEKTDLGILTFDVTSAPAAFVAEEAELLSKFLKVTADANDMWNNGDEMTKGKMIPVIAKDAGMDEDGTAATMATFTFPSVDDQLSDAWMGAGIVAHMEGVANVFVETGNMPAALDSYDGALNADPLTSAKGM